MVISGLYCSDSHFCTPSPPISQSVFISIAFLNGSVCFYVTSSVKFIKKGGCSKKHKNILNMHADAQDRCNLFKCVKTAETVYVIDTA